MSDRDAAMIAHASRRGLVWVAGVEATLIAWQPRKRDGRRRTNHARVAFDGRPRTVRAELVTVRAVAE